ncbi:MAG: ABC transporter permease, partial [Pseudomonadota bacterium]
MAVASMIRAQWSSARETPGWLIFARSLLALLILWSVIALIVDDHAILPQPFDVFVQLFKLLQSGEIFDNAATSLSRLL